MHGVTSSRQQSLTSACLSFLSTAKYIRKYDRHTTAIWVQLTHKQSYQSPFVSVSATKLLILSIYHCNLLTADTTEYVKADMADFMTSKQRPIPPAVSHCCLCAGRIEEHRTFSSGATSPPHLYDKDLRASIKDQAVLKDGVKFHFVSYKLLRFCQGKLDP